ncbi:hypothetical protein TEA_014880 [Camellia sinensis var. sinensis]|uniref:Uncharacterized protein n=1 Tax=Camellia sinensis var. sinensis TaxID=542762 RepID=A0A4S4E022_CAMSN|nr:hypothetical protein TEA_014880 [Camellia sinensis var. sinensis]
MKGLYYGTKESVRCAVEMVKRDVVRVGEFTFFDGRTAKEDVEGEGEDELRLRLRIHRKQLKDEMRAGYWTVAACSPSVIGLGDTVGLWEEVHGIMGPRKGISANPIDASRFTVALTYPMLKKMSNRLLGFDDQNQQRSSAFRHRDTNPDSIIFTVESNFSLFSSTFDSINHCSVASDVHDHDSFVSQLTQEHQDVDNNSIVKGNPLVTEDCSSATLNHANLVVWKYLEYLDQRVARHYYPYLSRANRSEPDQNQLPCYPIDSRANSSHLPVDLPATSLTLISQQTSHQSKPYSKEIKAKLMQTTLHSHTNANHNPEIQTTLQETWNWNQSRSADLTPMQTIFQCKPSMAFQNP